MIGHRVISTQAAPPDLWAVIATADDAWITAVICLAIVEQIALDPYDYAIAVEQPGADWRDTTIEGVVVWEGDLHAACSVREFGTLVELLPLGVSELNADELDEYRARAARQERSRAVDRYEGDEASAAARYRAAELT